MLELKAFISNLISTIRALLRLTLLTIGFFISGLNNILFSGRQVAGYGFIFDYLSQDVDKITYIEKLNSQIEEPTEVEYAEDAYIEGDEEDFE